MSIVPGSTVNISFWHMARYGSDKMEVFIEQPIGGVAQSIGVVTGSGAWTPTIIPHTFNTGANSARLIFRSLPNSNGITDGGNFLDYVNVNLAVPQIYGPANVCSGGVATYTESASGGAWSCSPASVGVINSAGVFAGVSVGTATITYTFPDSCKAYFSVNVEECPTDCSILCNGDFEYPWVSDLSGYADIVGQDTACWHSTQTEGIEYRNNLIAIGMPPAFTGHQYVELNAESVGTIYQVFNVNAPMGGILRFAHKGRYNTPDVMRAEVYSGGLLVASMIVSDNDSAWKYYSLPVGVLSGSGKVQFVSVSSPGAPDGGNYLDSVSLCVYQNTTSVRNIPLVPQQSIVVYPNPNDGHLVLSTEKVFNNAVVRIIDITGKVILERYNLNGKQFSYDISDYANGMYIIEANNSGEVFRSKFAKE
jgi:hypothetical protein